MTTPYYQDEWATLYCADMREVIAGLPECDLMVTDPPYGINFKSGWSAHEKIANDDSAEAVRGMLLEAAERVRRGRHAYVFGRWDFSETRLTAHAELVWDKGIVGMGDLSMPWGTSHEPITFALHQPSKANRAKGFGNLSARIRQGSVLRVDRTHSATARRHPTEKPVLLLRQLIESSSVMGEIVLDPFVGVGSTLVAASLEGRRSIGVEVDERYCESAAKRLAAVSVALSDKAA